jgi:protein-S-isoprenylcysteine O-methyltransferase Ste14
MNTARYVLALLSVMTYPMAVGWWYITHPLIDFWRKLGRPLFYTLVTFVSFAVMAAIYFVREPILSVEYGTNPMLWPLVVLFYGLSVWVEVRCRKHLKTKILFGSPELDPSGHGGQLIAEGIYGKVRHPRYVAVFLGTIAVAFFCNYLAVYILVVLLVPALNLVVVLEERELRDRFGEEYVRYCERVPRRFIPQFGR